MFEPSRSIREGGQAFLISKNPETNKASKVMNQPVAASEFLWTDRLKRTT